MDIDLDGDADVVCSMPTGDPDAAVPDHLRVFRTGPGGFIDEAWYPAPDARAVASGDFDQNGTPELVAFGPAGVWILTNLGRGWFSSAQRLSRRPASTGRVADLDGDGRPDIAALHAGQIRVWRGRGAGQFQAPVTIAVPEGAMDMDIVPRSDARPWIVTAPGTATSFTISEMNGRDGA